MTGVCKNHESHYRQVFKASRQKATPARLAILEALEHASQPLSAEEIKDLLPKGRTDLATVYRNLEMLKDNGWVSSLNISSQTAYYELAKLKHHHHLVCEGCGRMESLAECRASQLSQNFVRQKGFAQVFRHSLEYFGLCKKCVKNN
jgi:Fe2+ or Zn2+ uptake regulation protein